MATKQFAVASRHSLAIHRHVDQNVFLAQNVHRTKPASTRNVKIHAQEPVELTPNVMFETTFHYVHVNQALPEKRSADVTHHRQSTLQWKKKSTEILAIHRPAVHTRIAVNKMEHQFVHVWKRTLELHQIADRNVPSALNVLATRHAYGRNVLIHVQDLVDLVPSVMLLIILQAVRAHKATLVTHS